MKLVDVRSGFATGMKDVRRWRVIGGGTASSGEGLRGGGLGAGGWRW